MCSCQRDTEVGIYQLGFAFLPNLRPQVGHPLAIFDLVSNGRGPNPKRGCGDVGSNPETQPNMSHLALQTLQKGVCALRRLVGIAWVQWFTCLLPILAVEWGWGLDRGLASTHG